MYQNQIWENLEIQCRDCDFVRFEPKTFVVSKRAGEDAPGIFNDLEGKKQIFFNMEIAEDIHFDDLLVLRTKFQSF